ncbi:MAG: hypothetical protein JSU01_14675 [Bacteroidetes bacterium]|nr:hypothetical protein [Bacteroidota bacterium]
MKRYKTILVFVLIAFPINLVMTKILFGSLNSNIITGNLVSCIITGIMVSWVLNQVKKKQAQKEGS